MDTWIIVLIVIALLAIFFSFSESSKKSMGCKYNKNCSCGSSCKCGKGCKCGTEMMTSTGEHHDESMNDRKCSPLTDDVCKKTEKVFKKFDPNATILPGIGLPSQNNGVCTILHGMPGANKLKINGLESNSPLANAALFSTECAQGKYLNLYEMMLPEGISSIPGEKSNVEKYAEELNKSGINVAGSHWHWWSSQPYVAAIHHQNVGMSPVKFAAKTVNALTNYDKRMHAM